MYSTKTELAHSICKKIGWSYEMRPLAAMSRGKKIYVRGTALKPDEAYSLQCFCASWGWEYSGPYPR